MTETLLAALAEVGSYESQEAESRLTALLSGSTDEQDDLIYESFRSMAFGRSRATWPLIARLTATYVVKKGSKLDTAFRRLAWLLERCEDEDVIFLRAAATASLRLLALPGNERQTGIEWSPRGGGGLSVRANNRSESVKGKGSGGQIVNLLVDARLASTGQDGEGRIHRTVLKSLDRVLRT
jgi:hypothetical protein